MKVKIKKVKKTTNTSQLQVSYKSENMLEMKKMLETIRDLL
jgi:hypothetical protein